MFFLRRLADIKNNELIKSYIYDFLIYILYVEVDKHYILPANCKFEETAYEETDHRISE